MRINHKLQNIKNSTVWNNITFLDTETRPEDKMHDDNALEDVKHKIKVIERHKFYLAVACHIDKRRKKEKWVNYIGANADRDLWTHIDQLTCVRNKRVIIAHNAKYDILASGGLYWLSKLGYNLTFFAEDKPFIMSFRKETEYGPKSIVMLSSTNWYGLTPLKKLGELFDLPKMDVDVFDAPVEEILPYCRRDVEILKLAVVSYIDFIKKNELGNVSYTIASQAMKAFRRRFMHHDIFIHDNERAIELERESYCGGRTECFRLGKIEGTVYGYDVNSMYPSVMRSNYYPTALKHVVSDLTITQILELTKYHFLFSGEVWLDTDEPVYPYKEGAKLIFPIGRFKATLSTPELLYAIEHGHVVRFGDIAIYSGEQIFTDYIDFFYNERLKAKAVGDKIHDVMFKLFLNSLYGKFGQQNRYYEKYASNVPFEPAFGVREAINVDTREKRLLKVVGRDIFYKRKLTGIDAEHAESFPSIAAHVTAYARMQLWSLIQTAGLDNVYYSDTDSLYVNGQGKDNLEASGFVDQTELGKVKLEKQANNVVINGLKDYVFGDTVKLKGIPKKALKLTENDYLLRLWPSTSSFLRQGDVRGYATRLIVKHLKREYNKGVVQPDGKITPFVLHEF